MRHALNVWLALLWIGVCVAQDPGPVTTQRVAIDTVDLQTMLLPMTLGEVRAEVDAWMSLVQEKSQQIADDEVTRRAADPTRIAALDQQIAEARLARQPLLERYEVAIDAFEAKGGEKADIVLYRKYASVVGGRLQASAIWQHAVNWIQSPEGGIALGINLLLFLGTLVAFKFIAGVVGKLVNRTLVGFGRTSDLLRDFFVNTTRRLVFFIGIVLALSMLGMDIGPFLAAIGAAGFVIGFALQGTLSNFASGVMILLYRPYDIGDYVQVADVAGTVEAMTLVSTSVKSPDNKMIVVPNSAIWGGIITNITGKDTRRVDLTFGVGYSDDLAKAEDILTRIVHEHPLVLKEPAPVIKVNELADSSVNFVIRPWVKREDYWDVRFDLTERLKLECDRAGISIPYPQRDVHLHQLSS